MFHSFKNKRISEMHFSEFQLWKKCELRRLTNVQKKYLEYHEYSIALKAQNAFSIVLNMNYSEYSMNKISGIHTANSSVYCDYKIRF